MEWVIWGLLCLFYFVACDLWVTAKLCSFASCFWFVCLQLVWFWFTVFCDTLSFVWL